MLYREANVLFQFVCCPLEVGHSYPTDTDLSSLCVQVHFLDQKSTCLPVVLPLAQALNTLVAHLQFFAISIALSIALMILSELVVYRPPLLFVLAVEGRYLQVALLEVVRVQFVGHFVSHVDRVWRIT